MSSRAQSNPAFWHTYPDRQHWPEDERELAEHVERSEYRGPDMDELRQQAFPLIQPSNAESLVDMLIRHWARDEYFERLNYEFDGPCTD